MKQILLFDTAIATTNIGDEIILDSVKKGMKDILEDALIVRLGTHIENYSPIQMIHNFKINALCGQAKYKLICGTNLFTHDLFHLKTQWMLNPFNMKLYKDAVLVGVGKTTDYVKITNYTRWLYKNTLNKKMIHSVRDNDTKAAVESLGLKAINTGCPTLWGLTKDLCESIPKGKNENAIISVSGYSDQLNRKEDYNLIECVKNNYKKVYAWIQTTDDYTYLKSLPNSEGIDIVCSFDKYKELLDMHTFDYIGTRLHGGVFALQHACRTIVISIDKRAEGFHEYNNLPIVRRADIVSSLEDKINSNFATEIVLDTKAINTFLNQFE